MPREIRGSVVVVTGATSGIGRATALELSRRGATVVLTARREEALRDLAAECEELGGRVLAVPTDTTDEAAVEELARRAEERFGGLDAWINNAAVTVFGAFDKVPPEDFRRVIEVDLFGYVHGARAALKRFALRDYGILVNVASVVGEVSQPYASAYVAAKFAVVGFSRSLRQELRGTGIRVCTVMPAAFDTPLFQHGANYSGLTPRPVHPVNDPNLAAQTIASLLEHPRDEVPVGRGGRMATLMHRLSPGLVQRMAVPLVEATHFEDRPAPPTSGNLSRPMAEWARVSGGWREDEDGVKSTSILGTVSRATAAAMVAVVLRLALAWAGQRVARKRA